MAGFRFEFLRQDRKIEREEEIISILHTMVPYKFTSKVACIT